MFELMEIHLAGNYLYFEFGGEYAHLNYMEEYLQKIRAACKEHGCYNVLVDVRSIIGLETMTTTAEHRLAKQVSEFFPWNYRLIFVLPKTKNSSAFLVGEHLESAAKNRGVRMAVYYDYAEAVRHYGNNPSNNHLFSK